MSDDLTCVAWSLHRNRGDGLHPHERQIMVIGEYLIVGTRIMKGVDVVEYSIMQFSNPWVARAEAVLTTERLEQVEFVLHIPPMALVLAGDAGFIFSWLKGMRAGKMSKAGLKVTFVETTKSGTPLDGVA